MLWLNPEREHGAVSNAVAFGVRVPAATPSTIGRLDQLNAKLFDQSGATRAAVLFHLSVHARDDVLKVRIERVQFLWERSRHFLHTTCIAFIV